MHASNWKRETFRAGRGPGEEEIRRSSIDKADEDFRFLRELIKTIDASRRPATTVATPTCARMCINGIVVKRAVSCVPLPSAFLSGSW